MRYSTLAQELALPSQSLGFPNPQMCPIFADGLHRSQNWLAMEIGVSPGYMSMLVNAGRSPSGRIRQRMLKALGVGDFHELFRLEDRHDST